MSEEIKRLLDSAAESYPHERIRDLCISAASFIAAIDSSSSDVAAYLEQRFGALLLIAYRNGGIREFERALSDARQLAKPAASEAPPHPEPEKETP